VIGNGMDLDSGREIAKSREMTRKVNGAQAEGGSKKQENRG
jgi:hypothetical protein